MQLFIKHTSWFAIPIGMLGMIFSYIFEIAIVWYIVSLLFLITGIWMIGNTIKIDYMPQRMQSPYHILIVVFNGTNTIYSKVLLRNDLYWNNKVSLDRKLPTKHQPEFKLELIRQFLPEWSETNQI